MQIQNNDRLVLMTHKHRIIALCGGDADNLKYIIDNWKKLSGYGFKNFKSIKAKQNKGHFNQFKLLLNLDEGDSKSIIPFSQIVNTTRSTFAALESLKENKYILVEKILSITKYENIKI